MSLAAVVTREVSGWPDFSQLRWLNMEHIHVEKQKVEKQKVEKPEGAERPHELAWNNPEKELTVNAWQKATLAARDKLAHPRKGEAADFYQNNELLYGVNVLRDWIESYENLRQPSLAEKVDNILYNLGEQKEGFKRGFVPKFAYTAARDFIEGVFKNKYARPEKLAAMLNGNKSSYAYAHPDDNLVGITEYGAFNFLSTVKELNLYENPHWLKYYIIAHELEHLKNPGISEQDIKDSLYEKYSALAKNGDDDDEVTRMYKGLAQIAHAFAQGHAGVGRHAKSKIVPLYSGRLENIDQVNLDKGRWGNSHSGGGGLDIERQAAYGQFTGRGPFAHGQGHDVAVKSQEHSPSEHNATEYKGSSPDFQTPESQEAAQGAESAYQAAPHSVAEYGAESSPGKAAHADGPAAHGH